MRGYNYQYLVNLYFDTGTLPNGDFVLYLSDGGDFYANFVNPSEEFIVNLLKRATLKIELQKYDFMRLYLYLSRLTFKRKSYRLMYSSLGSRWCLRRELKNQLNMVGTSTFYKPMEVKDYDGTKDICTK